ncbi:hypothetical protein IWQ62_003729 [Dispira parvispora]|uniref:GH18 domain-containing protein n=1 Tax=Dispira parvispora TaxID=1520584 RepID=A0A9W8AN86_9FUNG|nr:hypothetical protein IWQ62_003729 [Dispira parvispora]
MVISFRLLLHGAVVLLSSGFFITTELSQVNAQPVDNSQLSSPAGTGFSQRGAQSMNSQSKVIVGYYPAWTNTNMKLEDISARLTHINFAFAKIDGQTYQLKLDNPGLFKTVRDHVRQRGTKILICVGGWTESKYFSPMITKGNRNKFIDSAIRMIKDLDADGIDFNWEFPDRPGRTGNIVNEAGDLPNYMEFLQAMFNGLSQAFGANRKWLTVTTPQTAYGSTGPLETVQKNGFHQFVNYINVMAYDLNGNWGDKTGPNAPLKAPPGDGKSGVIPGSVDRAISTWLRSGMPAEKIVVGLAFYGRSTFAQVNMQSGGSIYVPRNVKQNVVSCMSGDSDGICDWPSLRKDFLDSNNFQRAKPNSGWIRNWDELSQTPWLYQPSTKRFISYDDPLSISIKVNEVTRRNLAGVMIWDIGKDYNGELMSAINFQGGSSARPASTASLTENLTENSPSFLDSATNAIRSLFSSLSSSLQSHTPNTGSFLSLRK